MPAQATEDAADLRRHDHRDDAREGDHGRYRKVERARRQCHRGADSQHTDQTAHSMMIRAVAPLANVGTAIDMTTTTRTIPTTNRIVGDEHTADALSPEESRVANRRCRRHAAAACRMAARDAAPPE